MFTDVHLTRMQNSLTCRHILQFFILSAKHVIVDQPGSNKKGANKSQEKANKGTKKGQQGKTRAQEGVKKKGQRIQNKKPSRSQQGPKKWPTRSQRVKKKRPISVQEGPNKKRAWVSGLPTHASTSRKGHRPRPHGNHVRPRSSSLSALHN